MGRARPGPRPRRRGRSGRTRVAGLAVVLSTVLIAGCSGPQERSLTETVREAVRASPGSGVTRFRSPDPGVAHHVALTAAALAVGADVDELPAGYRVGRTRVEDGGDLVVLDEEPTDGRVPGHGLYVVRPGLVGGAVVQVPHPVADRSTEVLGVRVFESSQAAALMVAGAHRRAGDGAADVAHRPESVFAAVDRTLVGRGTVVLQLHGFAADDRPESYGDVVLSSARAEPSRLVRRLADALEEAGIDVCVYDGRRCAGLAGRNNVQGAHAHEVGADFVHIEVSDALRSDDRRTDALVDALADVASRRAER